MTCVKSSWQPTSFSILWGVAIKGLEESMAQTTLSHHKPGEEVLRTSKENAKS